MPVLQLVIHDTVD